MKKSHRNTITSIATLTVLFGLLMQPLLCANAQYQTQYSLYIQNNNQLGGRTAPSPGVTYYEPGFAVQVTAETYPGYVFNGWYLNGVFQNKLETITITMLQNNVLTASFSKQALSLRISASPHNGGTTNPPTGTLFFEYGNSVEVTAQPATGFVFSGWYLDDAFMGMDNRILVTMAQDRNLIAYFTNETATPTPTPGVSPTPSTTTPEPTAAPASLPQAMLDVTVDSSATYTGFDTQIGGKLTTTSGAGLPNTGILLYVSVSGGASWDVLSFVNTDANGDFSVVWKPSVTGNYLLNATWAGNSEYAATNTLVNFALTAYQDESVFSVTSNSTLSGLMFNSAENQLSFSVTGPSGTTGTVDVVIPKTMDVNISALQVFIDGNPIAYTQDSQDDSWIVSFTYSHSTHQVSIDLNSDTPIPSTTPTPILTETPTPESTPTPTPSPSMSSNDDQTTSIMIYAIIGAVIIAVAGIIAVVILKRGK
ncbi:MAG: InlB B-repeat-containing protein [Candidatus Bathyarchaeota archaeon]|nr:InlB B-repeat-containing protein [Candidatus Bathyarchaeota archaeon]